MVPNQNVQYILLEIHYDNPELKSDIIDNSGIKFYYTQKLRKYDLGLMLLGSQFNSLALQIPPKSNKYTFTSTCYPQCTEVSLWL